MRGPRPVHRLPLFREAFAKRRCLISVTGFYGWQQREDGKQPFRFRRKDLDPFAFAGIWEFARLAGEEILCAAIGTMLIIILILVLIGVIPTWGHSRAWGYGPSGIVGLIFIVVIILALLGRL